MGKRDALAPNGGAAANKFGLTTLILPNLRETGTGSAIVRCAP
jgi:hypothetical protein